MGCKKSTMQRECSKICTYFLNLNNGSDLGGWVGYGKLAVKISGYKFQGGWVGLRKSEHCSDFKSAYIFWTLPNQNTYTLKMLSFPRDFCLYVIFCDNLE